ncbi:Monocarboxylate transporter [Mycena chlorophos]|uniref:Monocarboxylate transporter n=1 Tax=Mycena chlorophos TaxID=658473 RepID=A0A8H6SVH3_MYCCL|nr:Monocarboxylate transporter [Mycena chlorophos]
MTTTYPPRELRLTEAAVPQPPTDDRPTRKYQTLLLLAGFMMITHIIGINTSFGIFQARPEFYTSSSTNISAARNNDAVVSLVGTLGSGLTWSGGIFVNPLMSRFANLRILTLLGAFIMSLGLFLAAYSTTLWQLFLTQSILYGVGSSIYYFPLMTVAPTFFDRHRGFAMGCILSGAGVGGLIFAPVIQLLLDNYGVRTTLQVLAGWNIAGRSRLNMALVKRGTFVYQALGALLQAAGNSIPIYYLSAYSISVLSYSSSTGSLFLAINSAVNSVSRILMGVLADGVGRQNTLITGAFLSSLAVFALWYDAARPRFIAFIIVYGIYAGGYNALIPTTITEIYGVENYTRVNGAIYFIRGLGSLLGAPVAGLILGTHSRGATVPGDALRGRFERVVVYDGVLLLCAGLCVSYVRWLDARDKGRWNWKA